jgi:hypothetical protein
MIIRGICETDIGEGKSWHYFCVDQSTDTIPVKCPDHPDANTRDFCIVGQEETMEIMLHQGLDLRLKWIGYTFTADASGITNYDFTMPFDAHLQEGRFHAGESKTGDILTFTLAPGIPGAEYSYIDHVPMTKGEIFSPREEFGMSALIPYGTPLRITYENTDSVAKTIVFKMGLRLPNE